VEQLGGLLLGLLAASVVARGCDDLRVPGHPLHGGDVGAGIEEVGDEAAAEIVGRARATPTFFARRRSA